MAKTANTLEELNIQVPTHPLENGEIITGVDTLLYRDYYYNVALFDESMRELDHRYVYLYGPYFYPYRGAWEDGSRATLPGIYYDKIHDELVRIEPITEEEQEEYSYAGKIQHQDLFTIRDVINNKKVLIQNMPESSKLSITPLKASDDILKRLVKMAIQDKAIDIDQYRTRFVDKNALFNFKQVLKGDNRLSMLLFDRGTSALNLKYTIILEEKDPEGALGKALSSPLVVTSEDTYDL